MNDPNYCSKNAAGHATTIVTTTTTEKSSPQKNGNCRRRLFVSANHNQVDNNGASFREQTNINIMDPPFDPQQMAGEGGGGTTRLTNMEQERAETDYNAGDETSTRRKNSSGAVTNSAFGSCSGRQNVTISHNNRSRNSTVTMPGECNNGKVLCTKNDTTSDISNIIGDTSTTGTEFGRLDSRLVSNTKLGSAASTAVCCCRACVGASVRIRHVGQCEGSTGMTECNCDGGTRSQYNNDCCRDDDGSGAIGTTLCVVSDGLTPFSDYVG